MKLAIIGGGGIRSPLFIESLVGRQQRSGRGLITELWLHDIRPERFDAIGAMGRHIIESAGSPLVLRTTDNLDAALDGASHVVTTIRAGFEEGRVIDERVPLAAGCIGQETVGPGGFAMAVRSIPAILHIAERAAVRAPEAWVINFTNPAGLLAQAMQDFGLRKCVGICDSADTVARDVAVFFGVETSRVRQRIFGLNHCSFTDQACVDGVDRLDEMLADDAYMNAFMGIYDKSLLRSLRLLPNEYLYYYFYPEQALAALLAEPKTRGEQVLELNTRFFADVRKPEYAGDGAAMLRLHGDCLGARSRSYMQYAWDNTEAGHRPKEKVEHGSEGYAGVALDFIEALSSPTPRRVVLNYLNGGAIPFFSAHDTAELMYDVSRDGIVPVAPGPIPDRVAALLKSVKYFENMASLSVRFPSRKSALWALESNPLVGDPAKAAAILDGFINAHGESFARFA